MNVKRALEISYDVVYFMLVFYLLWASDPAAPPLGRTCWYGLMRTAYWISYRVGRIGMRAECAYRKDLERV